MSTLFTLCCALSAGGLKMRAHARRPAELKCITMFMLALGFVWCGYYLVLGAVDASQAEYATAMSQLIVSVLTIVSVVFAFSEFMRASFQRDAEERLALGKDDRHERDR